MCHFFGKMRQSHIYEYFTAYNEFVVLGENVTFCPFCLPLCPPYCPTCTGKKALHFFSALDKLFFCAIITCNREDL